MSSDEKRIPHGVCRGGLLVAWGGFEPPSHSQALVLYLTSYRLNDQAMVGKGPQLLLRAFSLGGGSNVWKSSCYLIHEEAQRASWGGASVPGTLSRR